MSASLNDKITETFNGQNPTSTTVANSRALGGTTLTCNSLAGWPTNTAVHFATYQKDSTGAKVAGTQTDWKGVISGSSINSLTRQGGAADGGNGVGDIVEMMPTYSWAQDLAGAIEAEHSTTGVHKLGSNSTITSSKLINGLVDTNGNKLLDVTATANAVNGLVVTNNSTGNAPKLGTVGSDTNIDLDWSGLKGTGKHKGVVDHLYNPYKFSVYRNGALTITTTGTTVAFDTALFDTGSNVNLSTGTFTAPIAGFYQIDAGVGIAATASVTGLFAVLTISSTGTKRIGWNGNAGASAQHLSGGGLFQLAANDTVTLVATTTGANTTIQTAADRSWMTGFLVSAT